MRHPTHDAPIDVEQLADLIAERLVTPRLPQIVTAAQLATYLGVSREVIYANADQLGAIRLGDGERPRLRFPLDEHTVRAWQARETSTPAPRPAPTQARRRATTDVAAPLLPIRGERRAA